MLKCVLVICLLFKGLTLFCQENVIICGKITDSKGDVIPFVSVDVPDAGISTMANENGVYTLSLKPGTHVLNFRFIGYRPYKREIHVIRPFEVNIRMEADVFALNEVRVNADKEDPAIPMIRTVMAARKYLRETPSYSCDIYTKGVQKLIKAPKKLLGEDVSKALNLDSNRRGIVYQSETKSKFYFRYPHTKEIMQASKLAGDNAGFSFNRALDLHVNLYNNLIQWRAWGTQSFVSPVADNALSYYNYKLLGSSVENGNAIYKIKIEPKNRFDAAFKGFIYLVGEEDDLRIYSVDLMLTKDARINFVDTLQISQQFSHVHNKYWLPSDITFRFKGKVMGFQFAGYFTGLYSNYEPNPPFPESFFNDEIVQIKKGVNSKDSLWWAQNRPVPLTDEEDWNYFVKDSIERKAATKHFRDSVQKEQNEFKPIKYALAGYTLNNLSNRSYWYFYPFSRTLFYNTVEGWGTNLRVRYRKEYGYRRSIEFEPNARYGFATKSLNINTELIYRSDTLKHESFTLKAGSDFLDLNNRGTINLFYNTLTTLFEGKNYLKLYKANYVSFSAQREIADGLLVNGGLEMARRFPMRNNSNKRIFADAKEVLSSNNPLDPTSDEDVFPTNNAFSFETKISYTYGQRYTSRPDGKIYEPARYPTIKLSYRKGIKGVLGSVVNYDFISADLYQDKVKTGLLGYSSFYLSTGKFINTKSLFYPDMHHFSGNQTAIYNPLFPNFHFLDYYAYATNDRYYEAHYEHNFSGILFKRIPLVRTLKLEEIIGGAYLTQPLIDYKEAYIGIQRLIFRFDYGFSWVPGRKVYHTYRLFYGF